MAISAKDVDKILEKNKRALKGQLIANAATTTSDTIGKAASKYRETVSSITKEYIEQYKRGGSNCPDPNHLGEYKFVDWIDKRYDAAKEDIIAHLKDYDSSKNPMELAKELSEIIDKDIDAKMIMRTETEKIRTAAKIHNMKENNTKYVRYVAVMDDRVRESHAALDGQIFPVDEAPALGEPNCRCTYVPATEMEYEKFSEGYGDKEWTADEAQKWLERPEGKMVGTANAIKATSSTEIKRDLFTQFFAEVEDEKKRMEFLKATVDTFKPDWCRVELKDLVKLPAEAAKPYMNSQVNLTEKTNPDAPILIHDEKDKMWNKTVLDEFKNDLDLADKDILNDFEALRKYIKGVNPTNLEGMTLADWSDAQHFINVNVNLDLKRTEADKKMAEMIQLKNGRTIPANAAPSAYSLQHELGHAMDNMMKSYGDITKAESDFWTLLKEMRPEYKKITSNKTFREMFSPSVYGTTKDDEFIAECFAEYYYKKEAASQISKDVVEVFKKMSEGLDTERLAQITDVGNNIALKKLTSMDKYKNLKSWDWTDKFAEIDKYVRNEPCDMEFVKDYLSCFKDASPEEVKKKALEIINRNLPENPVTEAVMKKVRVNIDTDMQELIKDVALISNISTYFGIGKASVEFMQGSSPSEVLDAYISGLCSTFEILFLGKFLAKHKVFHIKPEKGTLKTIMKKHFTGNATPETTDVMNSMKRFIQTDGREV